MCSLIPIRIATISNVSLLFFFLFFHFHSMRIKLLKWKNKLEKKNRKKKLCTVFIYLIYISPTREILEEEIYTNFEYAMFACTFFY